MSGLFDGPGPRLYSIDAGAPFLDTLAQTLLVELGDPKAPFALADAIVLTPTRRASRELVGSFLRAAGGAPPATLLPVIRPLGDLDENEPPFEPGDIALSLPGAVSPARRRFELAALLRGREEAQGGAGDPVGALALADELAALFDELAEHDDADLAALSALSETLPSHFQDAAKFMEIVRAYWPARLQELGALDPSARHVAVARTLAAAWRERPPTGPVIAAGSTGTAPSTALLLAAIAHAPRGCVVLPGLDWDLDEAAWNALDQSHPQGAIARLLQTMGASRADVRPWPGPKARSGTARARVINEALRPASATADWLERIETLRARSGDDPIQAGFAGLSLVEAADEDEEALVVALAAREAVEDPDRSVLIVTPDSALVRRVRTVLARWGVVLDASFGAPLAQTGRGAFLSLVLEFAADPTDPVALTALATHSLCRFGLEEDMAAAGFHALDRAALRGVRARSIDAFQERAAGDPQAEAFLAAALDAILPLSALMRTPSSGIDAAGFARAHALAAERVAGNEAAAGADRLWSEPDGEAAAALLGELLSEATALGPLSPFAYGRVFSHLARARTVRAAPPEAPRVRALPPIEARLLSADRVILAGLNEGVWPQRVLEDAFMSRGMRTAAGLPDRERRVGQSAHDFAQLANAPDVLLTRARKVEGAPSVASRWIWRLQAVAAGAEAPDALTPATPWTRIAAAISAGGAVVAANKAPRPRPRPPVSARPTRLSVSRIGEWMRDPYGLYARRILALTPLDPLDRQIDAREHGTAVHAALETCLAEETDPVALSPGFSERLLACALGHLERLGAGEDALARARPRLAAAAAWVAEWETARRADGWAPAGFELEGEHTFETLAGPFTATATADRIDRHPLGWGVLDYKTGAPPSAPMVAAGLEPQLPIEGAILAAGGFTTLPKGEPIALTYVRVRGGPNAGQEMSAVSVKSGDKETPDLSEAEAVELAIANAVKGLVGRVEAYSDPMTPYPPQTRPRTKQFVGDYDRLSRRAEWSVPDEDPSP